jgi:nicotinamidase-related amidase
MPATNLDPKTALVVIDLQKGIVGLPTVSPLAPDVIANAARLVEAFRAKGLPVVLVTVGPSEDGGDSLRPRAQAAPPPRPWTAEFAEPVPEMVPRRGDILVRKRSPNAFYGTELDLQLRRRGVTGIVLCGIATSIGVDTTARGANERGYNVTFATDAMCDLVPEIHDFELARIFPRLGELDTTDAILGLLAGI